RGFLVFGVDQLGMTPEKAMGRPLFEAVDAIEALNSKVTEKENRFSFEVAECLGLPATGGSDAHEVSEVGIFATRFSRNIRNEADLVEALRSGNCSPVAFRRGPGLR
ncbi:MAG: PHP-associated domain-containing protein, partial [Pseudomonadota bacterium]